MSVGDIVKSDNYFCLDRVKKSSKLKLEFQVYSHLGVERRISQINQQKNGTKVGG